MQNKTVICFLITNNETLKFLCCCAHVCSVVSNSFQAPPSVEFSRQEYWCGLPFPPLGDLPRIKLTSPASPALAGGFLSIVPPGTYFCFCFYGSIINLQDCTSSKHIENCFTYIYTHIYIRIHTYTHIYIHTHI